MPRVSSCDLRLAVTVTSPGVWPCSSPGAPPWPRVGLEVSVVAVCAPSPATLPPEALLAGDLSVTSAPLGPRVRAGQRVSRPAWWPRLPAPRESVTLTPALAATTALASRPHAFSRYSEKPCKTARAISAAEERREVTAGNRGLQGPSHGSRPSLASCGDKAPLPCVSRAPAAPPETGVRASPQRPTSLACGVCVKDEPAPSPPLVTRGPRSVSLLGSAGFSTRVHISVAVWPQRSLNLNHGFFKSIFACPAFKVSVVLVEE